MDDIQKRDVRTILDASTEDAKYFYENLESLRQQYPDKYVAIHDGEVIASGKNYSKLLQRLRTQYGQRAVSSFFINFVDLHPVSWILSAMSA
ncbi:MAG: DUF5678 domain-containing protein [Candidatus Paceibacterota bacterium]